MIRILADENKIVQAKRVHVAAMIKYIQKQAVSYQKQLYGYVTKVLSYEVSFEETNARDDWNWLEKFLLADVAAMRSWTLEKPDDLKFISFSEIYKNLFSNGAEKYLDDDMKYNAYALIENLGVKICPYCEEEYLHVLHDEKNKLQRTLELDHFFPKSIYPALAMCFYNLVPSGQVCNGIKKAKFLGQNPYEMDIEDNTYLFPDCAIGINLENLTEQDCQIQFHPKNGMKDNVTILCLEERYENHKDKAYKYLKNTQKYSDAKLDEMVHMGFFSSRAEAEGELFDIPQPGSEVPMLLKKLRRDIVGK